MYYICGIKVYDFVFNHVGTLLAFHFYKEWLLMSLANKNLCVDFPYRFYINELKLRNKNYCTNGMDLNLYPIIQILAATSEM